RSVRHVPLQARRHGSLRESRCVPRERRLIAAHHRTDQPLARTDESRRRDQAEKGRAVPRRQVPDPDVRRTHVAPARDAVRQAGSTMSRTALFAALIAMLGGAAAAQVPGAAAKAAARKAVAATNAHIAAEQAVEDPPQTVRLQGAPAAHLPTPPHAPEAKTAVKPATTAAKADTIPPDAIQRELFEYPLDGR